MSWFQSPPLKAREPGARQPDRNSLSIMGWPLDISRKISLLPGIDITERCDNLKNSGWHEK
ncbi:hypothetical protein [Rhizobium leguminosarum]|uniref:hypothetical protein n=1 Tax=Rhizobium leguminosarum TaxID=384 RepID=UPI0013C170A2|nr:hypothetical protein [Rhizobium leguminosarum]NEJ47277.1 hypothetical protein [Rhizobium leguminosarum]NEJ50051.1 hypothetical protein [Rhizobium leguminosarum]NKL82089.1 hypothetical protein [Rhizobium leguminosarum bv. viciae]